MTDNQTVSLILHFEPPKATAQEKGVAIINGKPHFYEKKTVRETRNLYLASLQEAKIAIENRQKSKIFYEKNVPIKLYVSFVYPKKKSNKSFWKITRPDTDNLIKLLKDCMTEVGFWVDDSQVCSETVEKFYGNCPSIQIDIKKLE